MRQPSISCADTWHPVMDVAVAVAVVVAVVMDQGTRYQVKNRRA